MTNITKLKRSSKNMTDHLKHLKSKENELLTKLHFIQVKIKSIEVSKIQCKKRIKEMKN